MTSDAWRVHVWNCAKSDYSVKEYCRINSLSYHAFNYWKRKFEKNPKKKPTKRANKESKGFIKLEPDKLLSSSSDYWMSLKLSNDKELHFYSPLDIKFLKEIISL
jgi:hypothetical protein